MTKSSTITNLTDAELDAVTGGRGRGGINIANGNSANANVRNVRINSEVGRDVVIGGIGGNAGNVVVDL